MSPVESASIVEQVNALPLRLRRELDAIRRLGQCSRVELHEYLGLRKATVTQDATTLLEMGLIREGDERHPTNGRPRLPLKIDEQGYHVLGVAIDPGVVRAQRVNLLGRPAGDVCQRRVSGAARLLDETQGLLQQLVGEQTLAVGVTVPGFVEPASKRVLFSAAWPESGPVDLAPLARTIRPRHLVLDNLTNGLAMRLQFEQAELSPEDQLVIYFGDGLLGASLLVNGYTIAGCIIGANELGHTRLPVETPGCYCGHTGCLERIFSADYLRMQGMVVETLGEAVNDRSDHAAVGQMTRLMALGLANAVNFCRVGRVVWATDLPGMGGYFGQLAEQVREQLFPELQARVEFAFATETTPSGPRNAAARALVKACYASGIH